MTASTAKSFFSNYRVVIALCLFDMTMPLASLTSTLFAYIGESYPTIPYEQLALIMTMPSLVGLFVAFAVGPLSLRVSKKLLLIICTCATLFYTMTLWVVGGNGPVELLYVGAGVLGFSNGANMVLITSILNDHYGSAKSATYLAIVTGVINVFAVLLPTLGGTIAAMSGAANWSTAYVLGLVSIPAIIGIFFLLPSDSQKARAARQQQTALEQADAVVEAAEKTTETVSAVSGEKKGIRGIPPRVFLIILAYIAFALCGTAFTYNISTYVITEYQLGTSVEAGLTISVFMGAGLLANFLYALWSKILKRFVATVGYALLAGCILLLVLSTTSILAVYIAAFLGGFGFNLATPYVISKIMEATPPRLVPVSMSLAQGSLNLFSFASVMILSAVGVIFGGGLIGRLLSGVLFGVVAAVVTFILFVLVKSPTKNPGDTA